MSDGERPHEPTVRKRQRARAEGRFPLSRWTIASAVGWIASAAMLTQGTTGLELAQQFFRRAWQRPWTLSTWVDATTEASRDVAWATVAFLALVTAGAVTGRLVQARPSWLPNRVLPDFQRVLPVRGWGQAATRATDLLALGIPLLLGVGLVLMGLAWSAEEWLSVGYARDLAPSVVEFISRWFVRIGIGLAVLAALDFALQRFRFEQQLHMTPEELRAEVKAIQTNPEILRARQQRRELPVADHPS